MKTLGQYFHLELALLLNAAKCMHSILKRMSSLATSKLVVELLDTYYYQSEYQQKKIQQYIDQCGQSVSPQICFAVRKLTDEGQENLSYRGSSTIRDTVLLMTINKLKYYEKNAFHRALDHAALLKTEEGEELLNVVKKKIADEEKKALDLMQLLFIKNKSVELKNELLRLLSQMLFTQQKEEITLANFLPEICKNAESSILTDALTTYLRRHNQVSQFLAEWTSKQSRDEQNHRWETLPEICRQCQSILPSINSRNLRDLHIATSVQSMQHLNIAVFEVTKLLATFIEEKELKKKLTDIVESEEGTNQSFTAIIEGSILTKGIDSSFIPKAT